MVKWVILPIALAAFLFNGVVRADDTSKPSASDSTSPRILQDPKTKVIYYLESDDCHVVAISPEGKLLWSVQVLPADFKKNGGRMGGLSFWKHGEFPPSDGSKGEDCIVISGSGGGCFSLLLNKKTGAGAGGIVQ